MITRRGLLTTGIVFLAAPAIVRVSSLMPVKPWNQIWGLTMQFQDINGIHRIEGGRIIFPDGTFPASLDFVKQLRVVAARVQWRIVK